MLWYIDSSLACSKYYMVGDALQIFLCIYYIIIMTRFSQQPWSLFTYNIIILLSCVRIPIVGEQAVFFYIGKCFYINFIVGEELRNIGR